LSPKSRYRKLPNHFSGQSGDIFSVCRYYLSQIAGLIAEAAKNRLDFALKKRSSPLFLLLHPFQALSLAIRVKTQFIYPSSYPKKQLNLFHSGGNFQYDAP
jgi:hypothetical protein